MIAVKRKEKGVKGSTNSSPTQRFYTASVINQLKTILTLPKKKEILSNFYSCHFHCVRGVFTLLPSYSPVVLITHQGTNPLSQPLASQGHSITHVKNTMHLSDPFSCLSATNYQKPKLQTYNVGKCLATPVLKIILQCRN